MIWFPVTSKGINIWDIKYINILAERLLSLQVLHQLHGAIATVSWMAA